MIHLPRASIVLVFFETLIFEDGPASAMRLPLTTTAASGTGGAPIPSMSVPPLIMSVAFRRCAWADGVTNASMSSGNSSRVCIIRSVLRRRPPLPTRRSQPYGGIKSEYTVPQAGKKPAFGGYAGLLRWFSVQGGHWFRG